MLGGTPLKGLWETSSRCSGANSPVGVALNQSGRFDDSNAVGGGNVPHSHGAVAGDADDMLLVNGVADIINITRRQLHLFINGQVVRSYLPCPFITLRVFPLFNP